MIYEAKRLAGVRCADLPPQPITFVKIRDQVGILNINIPLLSKKFFFETS